MFNMFKWNKYLDCCEGHWPVLKFTLCSYFLMQYEWDTNDTAIVESPSYWNVHDEQMDPYISKKLSLSIKSCMSFNQESCAEFAATWKLPNSEVRCQRRCFNYSTGILCTNITACQAIYHGFPRGSSVIKDGNYIFITQDIASSLFIALSIF